MLTKKSTLFFPSFFNNYIYLSDSVSLFIPCLIIYSFIYFSFSRKAQLKEIFTSLNYDKIIEGSAPPAPEGGAEEEKKEEGGEAPPPAPVEPPKMTENAEQTFDLLSKGAESIHIVTLLSTLMICKSGYSENVFRFACKAIATDETNSLKESPLHLVITSVSNRVYSDWTPVMRTHLRKVWRTAEKFQPPAPEPTEEVPEPVAPVVAPEDSAVLVDDFITKINEDEILASLLTKEVAVPIEQPASEAPAE